MRIVLALLIFAGCLMLSGLAVVFGAYAGLASGTAWMQGVAAAVFALALAGGGCVLAAAAAPALFGTSANRPRTLVLAAVIAGVAAAVWFGFFFRVV